MIYQAAFDQTTQIIRYYDLLLMGRDVNLNSTIHSSEGNRYHSVRKLPTAFEIASSSKASFIPPIYIISTESVKKTLVSYYQSRGYHVCLMLVINLKRQARDRIVDRKAGTEAYNTSCTRNLA